MKSAAYIFTINVNKLTLIADIIINRDLYQREWILSKEGIFNNLISR